MTLLVFLLLPEFRERLSAEFVPLLQAIAWAALLTAASVAAFVGEIRAALAARGLLATVAGRLIRAWRWRYWPD